MKNFHFIVTLLLAGFISSCSEDLTVTDNYYKPEELEVLNRYLNLPSKPFDYKIKYPSYITSSANTNIDYNKATLGRVLFYDKSLYQ